MKPALAPNTAIRLVAMGVATVSLLVSAVLAASAVGQARHFSGVNRAAHSIHATMDQLEDTTAQAQAGEQIDLVWLDEAVVTINSNLDLALSELPEDHRLELSRHTQEYLDFAIFEINAAYEPDNAKATLASNMRAVGSLYGVPAPHEGYDNLHITAETLAAQSHNRAMTYLVIATMVSSVGFCLVFFVESKARSGRAAANARFEVNERYREIIETSSVHIYLVKPDGTVTMTSPAAEVVLGMVPKHISDITAYLRPQDAQLVNDLLVPSNNPTTEIIVAHAPRINSWYEVTVSNCIDKPAIAAFVVSGRDITTQVDLQEQLRHQAETDELTSLPNRRALTNTLSEAVQRSEQTSGVTGLVLIDLDRFKGINDTLGHPVGDSLLGLVGDRLIQATRAGEEPARLGGDEFAILLALDAEDPAGCARQAADRYLDTIRGSYEVNGQLLTVSASVGIAISSPGTGPDAMFRYADIALYEAKRGGGGMAVMFQPEMEQALLSKSLLQSELQSAVVNDQFTLHYQPLVSLSTGRTTGFEALMRWDSPVLGKVSPGVFIPAAEQSGLIIALGRWAVLESAKQLVRWQSDFSDPNLSVAVNASIIELTDPSYPGYIAKVLDQTGLAPQTLQIEVTESMLADEMETIVNCLQAIRSLGVRVALDDFGTGYSSMSQLRALPVDSMKIDREFVDAIRSDKRAADVVNALIELGHALGLTVIAEGIEEQSQLAALVSDPYCDFAQGFYLAKPMQASAIPQFLSDGIPAAARAAVTLNSAANTARSASQR